MTASPFWLSLLSHAEQQEICVAEASYGVDSREMKIILEKQNRMPPLTIGMTASPFWLSLLSHAEQQEICVAEASYGVGLEEMKIILEKQNRMPPLTVGMAASPFLVVSTESCRAAGDLRCRGILWYGFQGNENHLGKAE